MTVSPVGVGCTPSTVCLRGTHVAAAEARVIGRPSLRNLFTSATYPAFVPLMSIVLGLVVGRRPCRGCGAARHGCPASPPRRCSGTSPCWRRRSASREPWFRSLKPVIRSITSGWYVLDLRLDVGHLVGQPRAAERVVVVSHPRDERQRDRSSHPRPGPDKLHSSVLSLELVPQAPAPRVVPCELVADRVAGDHQPERTDRCVVVRGHCRACLRAHRDRWRARRHRVRRHGGGVARGRVCPGLALGSGGRRGAVGGVGVATVSAETVPSTPEAPALGRTTSAATTAAIGRGQEDDPSAAGQGGARELTLHRSTINQNDTERGRTPAFKSTFRTDP